MNTIRKKIFEVVETGNDSNLVSKVYDRIMMILIAISIIPLLFHCTYTVFKIIDIVTATIFILDYILRWLTADYKLKNHNITAFIKYPFTPFAIIDILSILPVFFAVNSGLKLFRLLRLGKAFKTLKFLRYSKSFNIILTVITKQKNSLLAVCYLSFGYIFLSALIMYSVEPESFDNFFYAIYWAVVTLTTVGYGDIYPVSIIGRIVSMISSFMGIAIVALPTGIITAGFTSELEQMKKDEKKEGLK